MTGDPKALIDHCLSCTVPAKRCNGSFPDCPGNIRIPVSPYGQQQNRVLELVLAGLNRRDIQKELNISSHVLGTYMSILVGKGLITKEQSDMTRTRKRRN